MTPWQWWAGLAEDIEDEGIYHIGECASRDEVIALACRDYGPGREIYVIEARSSTSAKHEAADFVPFLKTRNKEILTTGLRPA